MDVTTTTGETIPVDEASVPYPPSKVPLCHPLNSRSSVASGRSQDRAHQSSCSQSESELCHTQPQCSGGHGCKRSGDKSRTRPTRLPPPTLDGAHPSLDTNYRSLLLFIPLRLGQDKFNMEYASALKVCVFVTYGKRVVMCVCVCVWFICPPNILSVGLPHIAPVGRVYWGQA